MTTVLPLKYNTAFGPKYFKLPGVKECLYHPNLPTFRRMDMDTAAHKLPDEHCRTTTPCSKGDFERSSITVLIKPNTLNYKLGMSSKGKYSRHMNLYRSKSNPNDTENDQHCDEDAENADIRMEAHKTSMLENQRYGSNQPLGSMRTWKFILRQEPYIDHLGQRPIPATTFGRYRSLSSSYGGQVSTNAWKP